VEPPRTYGRWRRPSTHSRRISTLLATALLAVGCVGQPTPSPTGSPSLGTDSQPSPKPATLPPRPTPRPDLGCNAIVAALPPPRQDAALPPAPNPSIAGADAKSVAAFDRASAKLAALESYQFSVDTYGVEVFRLELTTVDYALRGTINRSNGFAMDTLVGMRMREFDNSAAISSGGRWVVGTDFVWATDNLTRVLEPAGLGPADRAFYLALTPDGLAGRLLVPFAGGYRRVGDEKHGGVMTQHFRSTPRGAAAYAAALQFKGEITADVWIAADGGHLSGARIAGKASHRDPAGKVVDDSVFVEFEVTHPNDPANVVELPAAPVPDPVPARLPVDLRLEYEVMRSDVRDPTTHDVDEVGVTLRRRLGSGARPARVVVGQPDKIVVTICGTTDPEADRRLIIAKGGVTVVPLPAPEYGTMAKPGSKALPAAGDVIDPGLAPIGPAARIGLGSPHVDPTTGRRGLAFRLENRSEALFVAFAKDHPLEYVALVLDDTVLATLPIVDRVANGVFVFTGDFTEAEARLLVGGLYADPLPFSLRLVEELEVPAAD
jgi:hypothetical protein